MPMLEIQDIHKSFGEREVLKGVGLTVEKGAVVAILGPSGLGQDHPAAAASISGKGGQRQPAL